MPGPMVHDSEWTEEEVSRLQFRGRYQLHQQAPCPACRRRPPALAILGTIGRGTFGQVLLVRDPGGGDVMAMKTLEKKFMEEVGHVEHCINERRVLASTRHPFLVRYKGHFQTRRHLFLLMEHVQGNDLFNVLQIKGKPGFGRNICMFYLAEVASSLEYLHSVGVVYRDLKLENILVDTEGHVKIVDFGFSKKMLSSATMCGTPEYLAPEILEGKSYGKGVDWWAFGVLAYELRNGKPPFNLISKDPTERTNEMKEKVMSKTSIHVPKTFESDMQDLVSSLLQYSLEKRLGVVGKVTRHKFFERINWNKLNAKTCRPPIKLGEELTRNCDYNNNSEVYDFSVTSEDDAFRDF